GARNRAGSLLRRDIHRPSSRAVSDTLPHAVNIIWRLIRELRPSCCLHLMPAILTSSCVGSRKVTCRRLARLCGEVVGGGSPAGNNSLSGGRGPTCLAGSDP